MAGLINPSYKQGFARSAGESENPGLWKGLVGEWAPALGPTGGTLRDVAGDNHGTLTNMDGGDWELASKGYHLNYPSSTSRVDCGKVDEFSGNFTIGAWFNSNTTSITRAILAQGDTTSGQNWWYMSGLGSGNTVQCSFDDNVSRITVTSSSTYADGVWSFALVTKTSGVYRLYLDDVYQTAAGSNGDCNTGDDLWIGDSQAGSLGGNDWSGRIGSAFIYRRAISRSEISALYRDHLAPFRRKTFLPYSIPVAVGDPIFFPFHKRTLIQNELLTR